MRQLLRIYFPVLAAMLLVAVLNGCTTSKINWDSRVGNYTYDEAIVEMGPPDRSAKLSDGRTVSEWLVFRGRTGGHYHYSRGFYSPFYGGSTYHSDPSFPDQFVRLTFLPEGRLENWKKIAK